MLQTSWTAPELPGPVPPLPSRHVLEQTWVCAWLSLPWCRPLLSSPRPFENLCSERVSPSSGEPDLGAKTWRQGGLWADGSWPGAGLGRSAPRGPFCLPGKEMRCGTSRHPGNGQLSLPEGPRGSHRPLLDCLCLFHSSGPDCFQSSLYICYESLFPD